MLVQTRDNHMSGFSSDNVNAVFHTERRRHIQLRLCYGIGRMLRTNLMKRYILDAAPCTSVKLSPVYKS